MRWILGDIHGMFGPLEAIVNAIGSRDADPRFIFVGDFVNRGPDSKRVIEFLLAMDPTRTRCVRGNHDDVLDLILNEHWYGGEREAFHPLAACNWFLGHGLYDTLASYGLSRATVDYHRERPEDSELLNVIRNAFPVAHKRFLYQLPVVVDDADLFVAHAFWPPEEANDGQHVGRRIGHGDDAELMHRIIWERFTTLQIREEKPWTRPAFFGHTPVSNYPESLRDGDANVPIRGPMITLLDTAIALGAGGRLTAVSAEDGRIIQVDRSGKCVGF